MWKLLNQIKNDDVKTKCVYRPRFGNLAKIPVINRHSSTIHWYTYESYFAVMGPKLWNCIPYHLNIIEYKESFKSQLTKFLMKL